MDVNVPIEHARLLAGRLPNVETFCSMDNHRGLIVRNPADDWAWPRIIFSGEERPEQLTGQDRLPVRSSALRSLGSLQPPSADLRLRSKVSHGDR
jgi:hypothetical protein